MLLNILNLVRFIIILLLLVLKLKWILLIFIFGYDYFIWIILNSLFIHLLHLPESFFFSLHILVILLYRIFHVPIFASVHYTCLLFEFFIVFSLFLFLSLLSFSQTHFLFKI